jgi:uncharacterized damage-inducible protein DinB
MTVAAHFIEVTRFEFQRMKSMLEKTVSRLNDEEFSRQPSENDNSIRIIVQHLAGNLLSRWTDFLGSDGEKPWRNRDAEFEHQAISRNDLMHSLEKGWGELFRAIDSLSEENLMQQVSIRNEKLTVIQALQRQVAHYSYHCGQVVFLAKMIKGKEWESLSIPKNKSTEFSSKGTYLGQNPH